MAKEIIYSITKGKECPLERREPTVGKWYVGVNMNQDTGEESYDVLAKYEGHDQWSDEDPECEIDIRMDHYDYLVEQK